MADIEIIKGADNGNPPDTLRQMYPKVNRNFQNINTELVNVDNKLTGHINSTAAHKAEDITYTGQVPGTDVKEAIDNVNGRISEIVAQSGDDITEIVDARGGYPVLGDRLNASDAVLADKADQTQVTEIGLRVNYPMLNSLYLSNFYKKMENADTAPIGNDVTITCQGDSITAGNGAAAGNDYPNQLKSYLQSIARPDQIVTMVNRGIGGDTAKTSFENWPTPSGGDICIIQLGTNDYNKNVTMEEFTTYYQKIIEREIKAGTGVILITPHKWRNSNWLIKENNGSITDYSAVIKDFGRQYNAPVLDLFSESRNLPISAYKAGEADPGIHFSDSGYKLIAYKLAAILGFNHPDTLPVVANNSFLNVRPAVDGIKDPSSFVNITHNSASYPGPVESTDGQGIGYISTTSEKTIHFSFYAAEDNLAIVPAFFFTATDGTEKLEITINGNNMIYQPNNLYQYNQSLNRALPSGSLLLKMSNYSGHANTTTTQNFFVNPQAAKFLYLPVKGWYTMQVKCIQCRLHGFDFLNTNQLKIFKELYALNPNVIS